MRLLNPRILFFLVFCFYQLNSQAQSKLVIDDKAGILNTEVEQILANKFAQKDIELTSTVNYKNLCDYYFITIFQENQHIYSKIEKCENQLLGLKDLGVNLTETNPQEKSVLLFYAIWDAIQNPSDTKAQAKADITNNFNENFESDSVSEISEHDSRYFFAPSAYGLKKGELYYNTIYFLLHDIQYGINDRWTAGIGTTIIGFPVYATVKYSIPLTDKSHLAFGDLGMIGTYGSNFAGNLLFSTYTYGSSKNNISIGAGLLSLSNTDLTNRTNSVVGNISGVLELGKYFYLLTENYVAQFENEMTATQFNQNFIRQVDFTRTNTLWYGLTGIRFVRKQNELISFQLGLTHVLFVPGKTPAAYDDPSWSINGDTKPTFVAIPTFTFTRKFKLE